MDVSGIFWHCGRWKVPKYGVFSGLHFSVFGLNTEIYGVNPVFSPNTGWYGPEKNSVFEHFSHSAVVPELADVIKILMKIKIIHNCFSYFLVHAFKQSGNGIYLIAGFSPNDRCFSKFSLLLVSIPNNLTDDFGVTSMSFTFSTDSSFNFLRAFDHWLKFIWFYYHLAVFESAKQPPEVFYKNKCS